MERVYLLLQIRSTCAISYRGQYYRYLHGSLCATYYEKVGSWNGSLSYGPRQNPSYVVTWLGPKGRFQGLTYLDGLGGALGHIPPHLDLRLESGPLSLSRQRLDQLRGHLPWT